MGQENKSNFIQNPLKVPVLLQLTLFKLGVFLFLGTKSYLRQTLLHKQTPMKKAKSLFLQISHHYAP